MEKLNFKQKIIVGSLLAILAIGIGIYGFISMQDSKNNININEMIEIENTDQTEQNKVIKESDKEKIVIHITGEVNKKGIVTLSEGARIADAIKAAGGTTKEADLDEVNLAYLLEDGQKLYIPNKKDKEKTYITNESGNNVVVEENNGKKEVSKKVNINQATQSELETLPGIGPSIASRIIEYRQKNGKFNTIEDLQNVKGIGDAKFANIKEHIVAK